MKSENFYSREISQNEKVYIEMNRSFSDMIVQVVVEGRGKIDIEKLREAVKEVSDTIKDSRVIYGKNKWVDSGTAPAVFSTIIEEFDGYNFNSQQLFNKKMNSLKDRLAEIHILREEPYTVLFRVFHGVMDGKGAILWIENIFRKLRNEELLIPNSIENDLDFVKKYCSEDFKIKLKFDCKLKKEEKRDSKREIYFKRLTLPNNYIGIIPKLIVVLNKYFEEGAKRYIIPVNIRRHNPEIISTGNLVLPIYLNSDSKESWLDIYKNMVTSIKEKRELSYFNADYKLLFKLPNFIIKGLMSLSILYQGITNKYLNSGAISNLGKINLEKFKTDTFEASTLYLISNHQPLTPFTITVTELNNLTEFTFSTFRNVISEERADIILEDIKNTLEKFETQS